jgi:polyvinyl alcohol dehydrogenase (cytochrome)
VPPAVLACQQTTGASNCAPPEDHFDSALALDIATGQIRWANRLEGFDTWTVACTRTPGSVNCPLPSSPDFDFSGPDRTAWGNIIGFGQKSGIYWALNPENGNIVWSTVVGPGSTLGGIEWGTATDGRRILCGYHEQGSSPLCAREWADHTWGAWSALDVDTGMIVWQTPDPTMGLDMGAVSVANGVVYAGSMSGHMYGLDTGSGKVLLDFFSGGSVIDSPSIADGVVFWGSGFSHIRIPGAAGANNEVFAFSLR